MTGSSTSTAVLKAYAERADADSRELSAIRLAQAVLDAEDVVPAHRRELLSIAVWKYTEARAGKTGLRYRTPAAMDSSQPSKVQHEHVRPRKEIVDDLLDGGAELVPLVLSTAVSCLVTVEEHARLNSVDTRLSGWDRYAAADLTVVDHASGELLDLGEIPHPNAYADVAVLRRLVRGGPARMCLLMACRLQDPGLAVGWAVAAAARDSESVEGLWLEQRLEREGDPAGVPLPDALAALRRAAVVFRSASLHQAADVLARSSDEGAPVDRAHELLISGLARCADAHEVGAAARACAPLALAAITAAEAEAPPNWEDVALGAGGGRYAALVTDADAYANMRAAVVMFDDPVLDVALTIFEKRRRQALPHLPAPAVTEWVRARCLS